MFHLSIPLWELLLRAAVVYVFLMGLLRLGGKRQLGQLSPFDVALLLVVSNAIQNSLNGGDSSLEGGLISSAFMVGIHRAVTWLGSNNKRIERIVNGSPRVLVHNGHVYQDALRREAIARSELETAMREAGADTFSQVHFAMLEPDGRISVILKR